MLDVLMSRKVGEWDDIVAKTTAINNVLDSLLKVDRLHNEKPKNTSGQRNDLFWKEFIDIAYENPEFAANFNPVLPRNKQWMRFYWDNSNGHYLNMGCYLDHVDLEYRFPKESELLLKAADFAKSDRNTQNMKLFTDDYGAALRISIDLPEGIAETDEMLARLMVLFKKMIQAELV